MVAPGRALTRDAADRMLNLAREPAFRGLDVRRHPQCFASAGHFAGSDAERLTAFLEVANDPSVDAVWFARGGYGSCRILDRVIAGLEAPAAEKIFLGYSDTGFLLSAFDRVGIGRPVHGPMVSDAVRPGGDAAIRRALGFFLGEHSGLEPSLGSTGRAVALNLSILAALAAGPHLPDLDGRVLMIEDVDEHLYAIDRAFYSAMASGRMDRVAGIRLGRVGHIPPNDIPFGEGAEEIAARWAGERGITYLGRADIGHDADNRIVPFR